MVTKSTLRRNWQPPLRLMSAAFASLSLLMLFWGVVINRNGQLSLGGTPPATVKRAGCILPDNAPVVITVTKARRVFISWSDSARQLQLWRAAAAQNGVTLSAEQVQYLAHQPYISVVSKALPAYFALLAPVQSRQAAQGMAFDSAMAELRTLAQLSYRQQPRGLVFCLDADQTLSVGDIRRVAKALEPYHPRQLYGLTTYQRPIH